MVKKVKYYEFKILFLSFFNYFLKILHSNSFMYK